MAMLSLVDGLDLLDRRTRLVRIMLGAFIGASVAQIAVNVGELNGAIDTTGSDLPGILGGLVYFLVALSLLASVAVVSLWIYRAHANLRAADIDGLEYTPGWAVGWYFIPFANLIKPFGAMRELWNVSLSLNDGYRQETDPRLKQWWGAWIAGNIISNFGLRLQSLGNGEAASTGHALDIVSTGLLIAASWLLLQITQKINAAQRSGSTLAHAFA